MKKLVIAVLVACLCILVTGCGNTQETENNDITTSDKVEATTESEIEDSSTKTQDDETSEGSKTLVVYFSNTGNTRAVAENIANGLDTDIYEIIAEEPYTDADLDYNDNNSRSTMEMNDPSARPAISGSVENMEQYDIVYIGYPIWWGEAPRIMNTFVESYDFTYKTVIPFCTSSSSGIGSSATNLQEVAGSGDWLTGQRFSGSESADSIMEWVNGL